MRFTGKELDGMASAIDKERLSNGKTIPFENEGQSFVFKLQNGKVIWEPLYNERDLEEAKRNSASLSEEEITKMISAVGDIVAAALPVAGVPAILVFGVVVVKICLENRKLILKFIDDNKEVIIDVLFGQFDPGMTGEYIHIVD